MTSRWCSLDFSFESKTHQGKIRKNNEDYVLTDQDLGLFIVCDGVGGNQAGEHASRMAAETLHSFIKNQTQNVGADFNFLKAGDLLRDGIIRATQILFETSKNNPAWKDMATTLDALWMVGEHAVLAHVGDGRIFLKNKESFIQLTEDHSYENDLIKSTGMSPEEAKRSPFSGILTRAVGLTPTVHVDILKMELSPGDTLFVCTDGILKHWSNNEIDGLLGTSDFKNLESHLSQETLSRGAKDNFSFVALKVSDKTEKKSASVQLKMNILKNIPFFKDLDFTELSKVLSIAKYRRISAGETIMKEGEEAQDLWILLTGQVDVFKGGAFLAKREPGISLGEMALVSSGKRTATVIASGPLEVLVFHRDHFLGLLDQDPRFAKRLLLSITAVLANRMNELSERVSG